MNNKEIIIPYVDAKYQEISETDRQLVDKAREATRRAYAPFSQFRVGAAILLDNGEIVAGANQENAAFPSGTCAERTACYYAHATYPEAKFDTIAIAAVGTDGREVAEPCAPCGACRQALLEYEKLAGHPVRVILVGRDRVFIMPSVKSLVPMAFVEF